jgi:mutator protein MutT
MKQLTILFILSEDSVLLAMKKRGFGEGRWNGVGGKVEPGETPLEAIIRECQEEIEVTPLEPEKVAEITFDEQHKGVREQLHVDAFVTRKWSGTPTETEEMAPRWFKISEIPYDSMWADDPYWLPQIFAGKKLKASFTLNDEDKVVTHEVEEVDSF